VKSAKIGRNDLCPCGSGKKWKRCHGGPTETVEQDLYPEQLLEAFSSASELRVRDLVPELTGLSSEFRGRTGSVSERIASLSRQSVVLGFSECDVLERL
jgi:hypothetical protein